jgi:putative flippase GtrA
MRSHVRRLGRYAPVAALCALLYNAIMIGLDAIGVHYIFSQAVSAAVLLPTGYWLQGRFTFEARASWPDFFRYSAALITNYPVAIAVLWLLRDVLAVKMIWASPIAMFALMAWNYATSSWAFSRRSGRARQGRYA